MLVKNRSSTAVSYNMKHGKWMKIVSHCLDEPMYGVVSILSQIFLKQELYDVETV